MGLAIREPVTLDQIVRRAVYLARAHRAQVILYVAMGVLVLGPLVLYVIFGRRK